jgi:hypothetical protein
MVNTVALTWMGFDATLRVPLGDSTFDVEEHSELHGSPFDVEEHGERSRHEMHAAKEMQNLIAGLRWHEYLSSVFLCAKI